MLTLHLLQQIEIKAKIQATLLHVYLILSYMLQDVCPLDQSIEIIGKH